MHNNYKNYMRIAKPLQNIQTLIPPDTVRPISIPDFAPITEALEIELSYPQSDITLAPVTRIFNLANIDQRQLLKNILYELDCRQDYEMVALKNGYTETSIKIEVVPVPTSA